MEENLRALPQPCNEKRLVVGPNFHSASKKGGMPEHPTLPFLVLRNSREKRPYQEAWKPARAPTSPESKPMPKPPVNTVLSLTRRPKEAEPATRSL